jgi:negative regulator of flagellin synthesis FlgM
MKIIEISGKIPFPEDKGGKKFGKVEEKRDRVEISSEARELYRLKKLERIEEIKKKVESGFYDSDEIINKVAERIYEHLKLNKQS